MNPYSRFRLVSNTAATALVAATLCGVWPVASNMLATATGGLTPVYWASVGGIAALVVIGSLMLTEWVLPLVFQIGFLRRMVLGRAFAEGTWLQAERGPSGSERLTIVRVRPSGFGFNLSAYSLNQDGDIEGTRIIEYSKLDGPVLSYVFRNLMPDGAGSQAQGANELMFENARGAPKAYAGYGQAAGSTRKFQIEGVKLTKWSERRRLRKLDQRGEIVGKYWSLFFGAVTDSAADYEAPKVHRPVVFETAQPAFVERRNPDNAPAAEGSVIARRRASDWRTEDATPTADRIRARMLAGAAESESEDLYEEDPEDEDVIDADADDADLIDEEDEVMFEDDDEDIADEDDETGSDIEDEEEIGLEEDYDDDAEAGSDDDLSGEDAEDEETADLDADGDDEPGDQPDDDEPVRIRQRYARRA